VKDRFACFLLLACAAQLSCADPLPKSSPRHSAAEFAIAVRGNQFVDASGKPVQLRGVNVSGLESGSVGGAPHPWDYSSLASGSGGQPDWSQIAAWKLNLVRLPLNEAAWLGLTVTYSDGHSAKADPAGDYRATVIKSVRDANAAGLYAILDLHWNAPGNFAPVTQNAFMDSDHSIAFWTSLAQTFKNNPAVIFELFNEPFLHSVNSGDGVFGDGQNWNKALRDGELSALYYRTLSRVTTGSIVKVPYHWTIVGYQAALDAVRATGASNVIILGGQGYDNDETWWSDYPPKDPLGQIALAYHAYPTDWGYELTGASRQHTAEQGIAMLNGPGVPVILTEIGGPTGPGASTTFVSNVLKVIDAHGWSAVAWTWNPWGGSNTLIQDRRTYTPTQGEGETFRNWSMSHP
jgi:aryl-phospho-beta-D-glucosidase BglC (GH1 family)